MSTTSTFSEESRSGPGRPDFPGKPGVSTLRHELIHRVPDEFIASMRLAKKALGYEAREESRRKQTAHNYVATASNELRFLNGHFRGAKDFGIETSCNRQDLADIARWLRGAKKQSDWVVFAVHCHESGVSDEWYGLTAVTPPDFLIECAHFAIDNGADAVVSDGTHFLRGIEIYKGKPIFYSLGNFIFQNETVEWLPQAAYEGLGLGVDDTPGDWGWGRSKGGKQGHASNPVFYRSAVAECRYEATELKEICLHPIDLGFGRSIGQRGRPLLAGEAVSGQVIVWLRRVSQPFGTEIIVRDGKGIICL